MKQLLKLILIGILSGLLLAGFLKLVYKITGNQAYILLYNIDYIPFLRQWEDVSAVGLVFHFVFCIASVIGLYYILKAFRHERHPLPYLAVYTIGSGILYFLTLLTDQPPAADDVAAWFYWTFGHVLFGFAVGYLVKYAMGMPWSRKSENEIRQQPS
ncbi:hypothetical protein MKY41_03995 [Sporosarcina sp. FSL W7-1349]|uniref:hypothetical protein n=1 Tax=Sporosarcina sp. FSL W7-1349 TaxID=2921561 RepID=UPI0030F7E089